MVRQPLTDARIEHQIKRFLEPDTKYKMPVSYCNMTDRELLRYDHIICDEMRFRSDYIRAVADTGVEDYNQHLKMYEEYERLKRKRDAVRKEIGKRHIVRQYKL